MAYNLKTHIKQLLMDEINPELAMHGGSVHLSEVTHTGDSWEVCLEFSACSAEALNATAGTLRAIEFLLREELSAPTLQVRNVNS